MFGDLLLMMLALLCGFQALRAKRLLAAAIWLAGVSVLVAISMYRLGAPDVAVIELSVGAGLVTVLFVFAIAIAGDEAMTARAIIPPLLSWLLTIGFLGLLGGLILPVEEAAAATTEPPFATVLWQERGLDVIVQVGLIFAGVMGILGLLTEERPQQILHMASANLRDEPFEKTAKTAEIAKN